MEKEQIFRELDRRRGTIGTYRDLALKVRTPETIDRYFEEKLKISLLQMELEKISKWARADAASSS